MISVFQGWDTALCVSKVCTGAPDRWSDKDRGQSKERIPRCFGSVSHSTTGSGRSEYVPTVLHSVL